MPVDLPSMMPFDQDNHRTLRLTFHDVPQATEVAGKIRDAIDKTGVTSDVMGGRLRVFVSMPDEPDGACDIDVSLSWGSHSGYVHTLGQMEVAVLRAAFDAMGLGVGKDDRGQGMPAVSGEGCEDGKRRRYETIAGRVVRYAEPPASAICWSVGELSPAVIRKPDGDGDDWAYETELRRIRWRDGFPHDLPTGHAVLRDEATGAVVVMLTYGDMDAS